MTALSEARQRIADVFAPQVFEQAGNKLVEELTQYLHQAQTTPRPVLPWTPPRQLIEHFQRTLVSDETGDTFRPDRIAERFQALGKMFLDHANRLHSPHYMGHQVPAAIPLAGLFDVLGTVTNQPMAIYEMGPSGSAAEQAVLDTLAGYIGWVPGEYGGLATHGGSLANLTALLTARNVHYPDSWKTGVASGSHNGKPAIVCSADSHYCNVRAAGILGLGTDQVIRAPLDQYRRLDAGRLPEVLDRAKSQGMDVFALVGSACSTPIGAFDPLEEMAQIAADRGIWFHVDGAHGASVLLSPRHRDLVCGIQLADSITWDAHKMLFMPALCTLLFYRDGSHGYETFQQDAPYLFDPEAPGLAQYDGAIRTLECTKHSMCTGLWGIWSIFGPQLFADLVDVTFDLAQQFHSLLQEADDFVPLHVPQCNIVCFRHMPAWLKDAPEQVVSQHQQTLRRRLIESGDFYITSTRLDGVMALRVTLINPLTRTEHLTALLESLRHHGQGERGT